MANGAHSLQDQRVVGEAEPSLCEGGKEGKGTWRWWRRWWRLHRACRPRPANSACIFVWIFRVTGSVLRICHNHLLASCRSLIPCCARLTKGPIYITQEGKRGREVLRLLRVCARLGLCYSRFICHIHSTRTSPATLIWCVSSSGGLRVTGHGGER